MTALVVGDNIEKFEFFPFRCIGYSASLQHGMQIFACFQNVLKCFTNRMFTDHRRRRLTEHAGAVLMLQFGNIIFTQPDLYSDPVAASRIILRFFRIRIIKCAIARGVGGKPQQALLIKFVNHVIYSCLLEGDQSFRCIDISENTVLIGLDVEDL